MKIKHIITESSSAQQAAIAIAKKKEQGVAEGSGKNVVKSVKVGNFRHDLVNTGMGWQVRIYNGDELYDTGLSKNSEEKGLAALDDSVAYTKKQLNIKEQGVAEGSGVGDEASVRRDLADAIKEYEWHKENGSNRGMEYAIARIKELQAQLPKSKTGLDIDRSVPGITRATLSDIDPGTMGKKLDRLASFGDYQAGVADQGRSGRVRPKISSDNYTQRDDVAEDTGDKKFDAMMKRVAKKPTQAQRRAELIRQQQERKAETKAHFAKGGAFGPSPADKLSIRKEGVAEGSRDDDDQPELQQTRAENEFARSAKQASRDFDKWAHDEHQKQLKKKSKEQGVAEGFNGEYDDEAGMAHSNLLTIARATVGLLDTIDDNENLPEWVQEKIAKVEGMLVTAWDYLQSQEQQGIDPRVDVAEGLNEFAPSPGFGGNDGNDDRNRRLRKLLEIAIKVAEEQNVGTMAMIPGIRTIASDDFFSAAVEGLLRDITDEEYMFVLRSAYKTVKQGNIEEGQLEETYHDEDEFYEAYGDLWYDEEQLNEAKYQGRTVQLGKPMQGDVKKFKVYVKNPKGNVVKVNFGQKGAKIKKSNPGRRKNFRARHNCDNPGPRTSARYWSCRKW